MHPHELSQALSAALETLGWRLLSETKSGLSASRYLAFSGDLPDLSPRGRAIWLRHTKAARPLTPGYPLYIRVSDHRNSGSRTTPHLSICSADHLERVTEAIALWRALAEWYAPGQPPVPNPPPEYAWK